MLPYQNLSLEDMPGEVWKDIPGWEGKYLVSSLGRVKSILTKFKAPRIRIVHQNQYPNQYLYANLIKNRKTIHFYVHRLVMMAFDPENGNKREVDHINGIRTDNRAENLRWVTSSENKHNSISEANYAIANRKMGKAIICTDQYGVETFYYSTREAARNGFLRSAIRFCLIGKHKTHKKCTFRYAD